MNKSADQYRIDSHKLHLHPRRVADWLEGRDIAPLYMEISPSGACNHRCRFCGMDFMGYKQRFLPVDILSARFVELAEAGLKSIMFAGEGEPFLHPQITRLTLAAKRAGLDVAFTSNGSLLSLDKAEIVVPESSWIKISCNAGNPETYAQVHGVGRDEFKKVLTNLEAAVAVRNREKSSCTIGAQMLLLPENRHESVSLARLLRDAGLDYLVIKPYSVHRQSRNHSYENLRYGDESELASELAAFDRPGFRTIFRHEAVSRLSKGAPVYDRCLALPFWGYLDSGGSLWGCLRHIDEPDFYYGNLLQSSARELLGEERRHKMAACAAGLDISDCRLDCRMEPINAWLWELTHPGSHANFI